MIKLIIEKKGFYIELPKIPPFRTPAKVDISKLNLGQVTSELRKQGIKDYVILEGIDKPPKRNKQKKTVSEKKTDSIDLSGFHDRFDKIEGLLQDVMNIRSEVREVRTIIKGSGTEVEFDDKEKEIENVDQFVPDVDVSGMKVKTSEFRTEKLDGDIEESSELLSKISKGKR